MTIYCPSCGKPNTDAATNCVSCNHELKPPSGGGRAKFKGTMMMTGITPEKIAEATKGAQPATPAPAATPAPEPTHKVAQGPAMGFGKTITGPISGMPGPDDDTLMAPSPFRDPSPAESAPTQAIPEFSTPQQPQGGFGFPSTPQADVPAQQPGFGEPAQPSGFGEPAAPPSAGFGAPPSVGFGEPAAPPSAGFGEPAAPSAGFGEPAPAGGSPFGATPPSSAAGFGAAPPMSGEPAAPAGGSNKKLIVVALLGCFLISSAACGGAYWYFSTRAESALSNLTSQSHRFPLSLALSTIKVGCTSDPTGAGAANFVLPQAMESVQGQICAITEQTVTAFGQSCDAGSPCANSSLLAGSPDEGIATQFSVDANACSVHTSGEAKLIWCETDSGGRIVLAQNLASVGG